MSRDPVDRSAPVFLVLGIARVTLRANFVLHFALRFVPRFEICAPCAPLWGTTSCFPGGTLTGFHVPWQRVSRGLLSLVGIRDLDFPLSREQ